VVVAVLDLCLVDPILQLQQEEMEETPEEVVEVLLLDQQEPLVQALTH
tara:strand:+ start:238 stop:381 length:144 start_codon:yes stop_codon:yes gene_type:complete